MARVIALVHASAPAIEAGRAFNLLRAAIVCACAVALIAAGQTPPC